MVTDIFYPASDTDRLSDVLLAYLIQCDISVNVTHLFYSFFWSGAPLNEKRKAPEYYNCIPGRIIQIIRGTTRIEK